MSPSNLPKGSFRMRIALAATVCVATMLPLAAAAAPPAGLKGKSVVVSWTEARVQREVGESAFRNVTAGHDLRVYVSGAGRVFSRLTNSTRLGSGKTEQVAGAGGATRVPTFSGQSMTLFQPFEAGGMRRIDVEFDPAFGGCRAKVVSARQQGAGTMIAYSPITKRRVEFQSVRPGSASCTLQSGNVFGGA
jgi:hypothetical protein